MTLYEISVPVMVRSLQNMSGFLALGRDHALRHGIAESDLVTARLFGDMAPLKGQVQRASDTAKFAMVRLASVEPVSMPDDEVGFDDLQARVAKTIAFLSAVPSSAFDGREGAEVSLKIGGKTRTFTRLQYLLEFALPNFFFHVTTAYDVLRKSGVPVGKLDYLGWS